MLTEKQTFTVREADGVLDCAAHCRRLLSEPLKSVIAGFMEGSLVQVSGYLPWGSLQRCRFELGRGSAHQRSCSVVVDPEARFHGLTVQEHRVASCVALGLSNQEIAEFFSCSPRTVDRHTSNIFSRLHLESRSAIATIVALSGGWFLPLPELRTRLLEHSEVLTTLSMRTHSSPSHRKDDGVTGAKRRLRIGSLLPAGDERFEDALAMARGEDLARTTTLKGGEHDAAHDPEIVRIKSTSESAQDALLELADAGVHAIVLGNCTLRVARQLLGSSSDLGIPLLHSMVDNRLRAFVGPTPRYRHIFQICSDETVYIRAFVSYVVKHLPSSPIAQRISLVLRRDERPSMQDAFDRLIDRFDVDRIQVIEYEETSADWASIALEIQQFAPDTAFFGIYLESSLISLLDLLGHAGLSGRYYCVWVPGIPGFIERHPAISEGLIWTTLVGNSGNHFGTKFRQAFRSTYGSDPGIGSAAVHFDMIALLRQAWIEADHSPDPLDLVTALQHVQFQGVTGSFHFENGRRKALCYPFDTDDPTIGQPYLTFVIDGGRSKSIQI